MKMENWRRYRKKTPWFCHFHLCMYKLRERVQEGRLWGAWGETLQRSVSTYRNHDKTWRNRRSEDRDSRLVAVPKASSVRPASYHVLSKSLDRRGHPASHLTATFQSMHSAGSSCTEGHWNLLSRSWCWSSALCPASKRISRASSGSALLHRTLPWGLQWLYWWSLHCNWRFEAVAIEHFRCVWLLSATSVLLSVPPRGTEGSIADWVFSGGLTGRLGLDELSTSCCWGKGSTANDGTSIGPWTTFGWET